MAQPAIVQAERTASPVIERAPVRRFELPDLDRHGGWLIERLAQLLFKRGENHLPMAPTNSAQLAGFIRGCVYSNEFLFLYQEHSVGLAQMDRGGALQYLPLVRERFVFVQNPDKREHLVEAADFYDNFLKWAKHQGASAILVEEATDVPHELIKEKLGRIYQRPVSFARV